MILFRSVSAQRGLAHFDATAAQIIELACAHFVVLRPSSELQPIPAEMRKEAILNVEVYRTHSAHCSGKL